MGTSVIIELTTLALRVGELPGFTASRLAARAEAASVCLEQNGYRAECQFTVRDTMEMNHVVPARLVPITERMRAANADLQEATEHGAEAIAAILSLELTPYTIVERARKGTGFDYWLGTGPLELKARLEISGILKGTLQELEARVRKKNRQTGRSDDLGYPAFICVVEFSHPFATFTQP